MTTLKPYNGPSFLELGPKTIHPARLEAEARQKAFCFKMLRLLAFSALAGAALACWL